MRLFGRLWQAQGAGWQSSERCWIRRLDSASGSGCQPGSHREKIAVESSHNWGPAASICILFLQREFNPKKERDFSIVRQALFGVKSRRSAEAAFLKGLVLALRLFSWSYVLEGCLHSIVCLKIFKTQRARSIPLRQHKGRESVW